MDDVSRETPGEPPVPRETALPGVAAQLFPAARLGLIERYADLLATAGVQRGLIGPREVPRLWDRHLANCAILAEAVPEEAAVADLGSGAGLPGLVLAIARPDLRVTLVEPLERRTVFLDEVVDDLGLVGVEVLRGRAEALHRQRTFDVVTARALAPLARLLGWAMPLVAPEGVLLAMKGRSAEEEIDAARSELERLRCAEPEILELGERWTGAAAVAEEVDWTLTTTRAVRVAHADPARVALPPAVDTGPGSTREHSAKRRRGRPTGRRQN